MEDGTIEGAGGETNPGERFKKGARVRWAMDPEKLLQKMSDGMGSVSEEYLRGMVERIIKEHTVVYGWEMRQPGKWTIYIGPPVPKGQEDLVTNFDTTRLKTDSAYLKVLPVPLEELESLSKVIPFPKRPKPKTDGTSS